MTPTRRIVLIGPTSAPWERIAAEVAADLTRLARPGVELAYHVTGAGPAAVTTPDEAAAAAPHVVAAVVAAEREGFDAAIIDCTDDPGLEESRSRASIPVIGAGEALRHAVAAATPPVVVLAGDTLRATPSEQLMEQVADANTVALGGTGWSHLVPALSDGGRVVLDPLDVALDACLAELADLDQG
jgi:Asp/Glu/hydantoin racemase